MLFMDKIRFAVVCKNVDMTKNIVNMSPKCQMSTSKRRMLKLISAAWQRTPVDTLCKLRTFIVAETMKTLSLLFSTLVILYLRTQGRTNSTKSGRAALVTSAARKVADCQLSCYQLPQYYTEDFKTSRASL